MLAILLGELDIPPIPGRANVLSVRGEVADKLNRGHRTDRIRLCGAGQENPVFLYAASLPAFGHPLKLGIQSA